MSLADDVSTHFKRDLIMTAGEIAFSIAIAGIAIALISKLFQPSKEDLERERAMKERLSDPYLYDPETGAKITLEQAEAGTWIVNDNLQRIRSKNEIDSYFEGAEKVVEEIANVLKSKGFKRTKINDNQIRTLEKSQVLSKYDDWSYTNAFEINNGLVILPQVNINYKGRGTIEYHGYQTLFWMKINDINGHYFLREKETSEKVFDLIRSDDEFKFKDYEVFTISSSKNPIQTLRILTPLTSIKDIEIEVHNDNLFIKTTIEPAVQKFEELYEVAKNVC